MLDEIKPSKCFDGGGIRLCKFHFNSSYVMKHTFTKDQLIINFIFSEKNETLLFY